MTICPIALAVGCKKCPAVSLCPLKSVVGNYRAAEEAAAAQQREESKREQKAQG